MSDLDDLLPAASATIADLIRWLWRELGRRPTLGELTELRAAMAARTRRRSWRRGALAPARYRGAAVPTAQAIVRDFLRSQEGKFLIAAIAALPRLMSQLAAARSADEYYSRPDVVVRLAGSAREWAARMPSSTRFEPPMRKQLAALAKYLDYKLSGGPALAPGERSPAWVLDGPTLAAINVSSPTIAREWRDRALGAMSPRSGDAAGRRLLREIRATGAPLAASYPTLAGRLPGPLAEPPPEPVEEDSEPDPDDNIAPSPPPRVLS